MKESDPTEVRSSDGLLDRMVASRDLWPAGTLDMWQGRKAPMPDRVYWPESETEVLSVLTEAEANGTPVIPYGAGSGVCAGARGRVGAVVLDMKAFQKLGPVDERRWTVTVGAGVNGQQLEDYLKAFGFTLGHSPSSIWC
ncbi:MAG: FAD-binding protein, partial [Rhodobacterales bacterium]|nr:FAD-binding protein [Rhodobacterales bacterium]